jgi:S1-C subfamily serine protease
MKTFLAICLLWFSIQVNGQQVAPVVTNNPSSVSVPRDAVIKWIANYEYSTVVCIEVTNPGENAVFAFNSKSYLQELGGNIKLPLMQVENNELDKNYNLGKKGQKWTFSLLFGRVPPGTEYFNLFMPIGNDGFFWKGVKMENPNNHPRTIWTESSIKADWEINGVQGNEGIYQSVAQTEANAKYKIAVKKSGNDYKLIYLSGTTHPTWEVGEIKGELSETATPNLYAAKWFMQNKVANHDVYCSFETGFMKLVWTNPKATDPESRYIKLYPTTSQGTSNVSSSGTGFALSSEGFIVTNYHVINAANEITVRGINSDFSVSYKAAVIASDKNNDLAILKIDDVAFKNLDHPPYTFSNSVSLVGESIYCLGYPLRSTMGDEVKLTNGIISSKTGFQGDITSYQISAPVQPGNSGGPLLNSNGEIVGIVSAKHTQAENASYAVKISYLKSLLSVVDDEISIPKTNKLNSLNLSQQVELVKQSVYIIECR